MAIYAYEKKLKIRDGEYFRGGAVAHGLKMPLGQDSVYEFDVNENKTDNQANGIFVSTQGRYIYAGGDFSVRVEGGEITVGCSAPIVSGESDGTLRGAYVEAMQYAKTETPRSFPRDLLKKPQFCTWTEMGVHVTQEKIVSYAKKIAASGFPHDLLIIDDGWSVDYGDWRFDLNKIPDPKKMMQDLHALGFRVSLWIVPFVNETAKDYQALAQAGAFVREPNGEVSKKNWWNGDSAVFDLTSSAAREYFTKTLDTLVEEYGVDGFKFDAGDPMYYAHTDVTAQPTTRAGQCALYSEIAKRYEIAEVRSGFLNGGSHLVTRLGDKRRSWTEDNGIRALVPNMIQAGFCGYPFSCADMIGGGNIVDFESDERPMDGTDNETEISARFVECNALMPAMQFSCAYWEKSDTLFRLYKQCIDLHESMGEYLDELITHAIETGEPILRSAEYVFPHQGYEKENDAFFLGDKYFVVPVIRPSVREIEVRLPSGCRWKYVPDGAVFEGGAIAKVSAGVETLPYFERIEG